MASCERLPACTIYRSVFKGAQHWIFHGVQKFSWYHEDLWCLLSLLLSLRIFSFPSAELTSVLIYSAVSPSAQRETSEDCRTCLECSHDNGCVRCPERLFLFLQRDGMSHHGTCLHACPAGHYGQRGKDINRCMSMLLHLHRSLSLTDIKLHLSWGIN